MTTKTIFTLTSLLTLTACGHYAPPESFESKMARYQVKKAQSQSVPEITPVDFRVSGSRMPASVSKQNKKSEDVTFSNKKLYFITLYRQYNELASFASTSTPEVTQCPSFHSAMVDFQTPSAPSVNWKAQYEANKLGDQSYSSYYPELYLPAGDSTQGPKVLDILKKEPHNTSIVQSAVDHHVKKIYAELAELCEYGSSDNYYAFENLHTEMQRRDIAPAGVKGMKVLLKTSLFSNKALIESLKRNAPRTNRAPAQVMTQTDFDYEVMKRLGVTWAQQYYQTLRQNP